MTADLFPHPWLVNNLLDASFVDQKTAELTNQPLPYGLADWLAQHFMPELAHTNEAQLEHSFIRPLLERMGWRPVPQMNYTVQGKQAKPDWCLALNASAASALPGSEAHEALQHMAAICEAKAWNKPLDTGKAHADNPHHQLMDYLATLRVRFGMLTNGRHWRLYDTREITARKTYLQMDLEQVLHLPDGAEKDRALARRFQRIDLTEPTAEECLGILEGLEPHYAQYHHVRYSPAALKAMVDLTSRHVRDRLLPDKAIDDTTINSLVL